MKLRFMAILENNNKVTHESLGVSFQEERDYIKSFIEYAKETALEQKTKVTMVKVNGAIIVKR